MQKISQAKITSNVLSRSVLLDKTPGQIRDKNGEKKRKNEDFENVTC